MPKLNLNPELEKLGNILEKYIKVMKDEVSRCDEKLKLEKTNKKRESGLESQKRELEKRIEKAQFYLDRIRVSENSNFIELGQPKKYWGSTEGWKEPVCERYSFKYDDGKTITLDIAQELSERLGLKEDENNPHLFYINKDILDKYHSWKKLD